MVATKASVTLQVVAEGSPETVELLRNGDPLVALTPPYSYTWDTTGTPEGTYTITARARRGSQSVTSDPVQVKVDRTPPQITARRPDVGASNVYLGNPLQLTFDEPLLLSSLSNARLSQGSDGKELTLRPQSLPSFATDLAGNALSGSSYGFTVPFWQQLGTILNANPNQNAFDPSLALDSAGSPVVIPTLRVGGSYSAPHLPRRLGSGWASALHQVLAPELRKRPCR